MFEIRTEDPGKLKRIVAAGTGGVLVGLALVLLTLVPLVGASGESVSRRPI